MVLENDDVIDFKKLIVIMFIMGLVERDGIDMFFFFNNDVILGMIDMFNNMGFLMLGLMVLLFVG